MSSGSENPYLGYTIFQFNPTSEGQVQILHDLEEERNDGVIFLTRAYHAAVGKATDVMVKPNLKDEFVTKLEAKGLSTKSYFTVRNSFTELQKRNQNKKEGTDKMTTS